MHLPSRLHTFLCLSSLAMTACVPVPTSTVPLHHREVRPVAVQTGEAADNGEYSALVFDRDGKRLAAYDSAGDRVRILRTSDLGEINSLKPARRPRRLGFSPGGRFLVIEAHPGWIEEHLEPEAAGPQTRKGHVSIDSPEAIKDNIQRVEVWDLSGGPCITDLACEEVFTSKPQGGWLWAKNWAITPGYRTAAILEAHFSADEAEFLIQCGNGVQQRWDGGTWKRLENIPAPSFWSGLLVSDAGMLFIDSGAACRSADGRFVAFRIPVKRFGSGTAVVWDRRSGGVRRLPDDYPVVALPDNGLSDDGSRLAVISGKGLGSCVRVWDLGAGRERPLEDANFNLGRGAPRVRSAGVALSPDGRHLAAVLLAQMEALLVGPVPNAGLALMRSDLRIWDVERGRELVTIPVDDLVVHAEYFRGVDVAFSPDGSLLAAGGRRIRIYRMSDVDPQMDGNASP